MSTYNIYLNINGENIDYIHTFNNIMLNIEYTGHAFIL